MKRSGAFFFGAACVGALLGGCDLTIQAGDAGEMDGGRMDNDGGNPVAGLQVAGSINGQAFVGKSIAAQLFARCDNFSSGCIWSNGINIRLSEDQAICDPNGYRPLLRPGHRLIDVTITQPPDAGVVVPGRYVGILAVRALPLEGGCDGGEATSIGPLHRTVLVDSTQSATVTLTKTTPTVQGTFAATLWSGAQLSGSFDAPFCTFYDWEDPSKVRCVGP